MSSEKSSNPSYKLHKKLMRRRAIRESWPLLVWLGIAVLAAWVYKTGGEFHRMRGVVSKPVEKVSARVEGQLVFISEETDLQVPRDEQGRMIPLEQGIYVSPGDVVAKVDETLLKLEIEEEKQNAAFDRAKILQQLNQNVLEFQIMIPQLQNDQQRIEKLIKSQENVRDGIALDVKNGNALQSALDEAQADVDKLNAELVSKTQSLAQTEALVETAVASIKALQAQISMGENENATINLLKEKIRQSAVKVTNAGFIDKIYARPGDVLRVGDPIMDLVIQAPKTIEALIPEEDALTLKQGDVVYIAIPKNQKEYLEATILSMQQSLTQIEDHSSTIRGRMIRGRMVKFGNLGGTGEENAMPLLPGSEVMITLEPPGKIPFLSWFIK